MIEIKGKNYTLREAMREPDYIAEESLVIGIFMTFYDVHVNRVPYPGVLSHRELDSIYSFNRPMLAMENGLVDDLVIDHDVADYLYGNQRVLNKVHSRLEAPILNWHPMTNGNKSFRAQYAAWVFGLTK